MTKLLTTRRLLEQPSPKAWRELYRHLEARGGSGRGATPNNNLERVLDAWPESIRIAPIQWWRRVVRREREPNWSLVRHLDLRDVPLSRKDAEQIAATEGLAAITELKVGSSELEELSLAELLRSPYLRALNRLTISRTMIGREILHLLADDDRFPALTHLQLLDNRWQTVGGDSGSTSLRPLAELRLNGTRLPVGTLARWASEGATSALTSLELTGAGETFRELAEALDNERFPRLRRLHLEESELHTPACLVAAISKMEVLEELHLRELDLSEEELETLGDSGWSRGLTQLDLSGSSMTRGGLLALARSGWTKNLESLSLNRCEIDEQALFDLLAHNPKRLTHLSLRSNKLTSDGVSLLCEALPSPSLRTLDLSRNQLTDKGVTRLAESHLVEALVELSLEQCSIGPDGARSLSEIAPMYNLSRLLLNENPLGESGVVALSKAPFFNRLRTLELAAVKMQSNGLEALTSQTMEALESLRLTGNGIKPEGFKQIVDAAWFARLDHLDLTNNPIGDQGIKCLLSTEGPIKLTSLALSGCSLGDKAAQDLSEASSLRQLEKLDLDVNSIADRGAQSLAWSPDLVSLRELRLKGNQVGSLGITSLEKSPLFELCCALDLSANYCLADIQVLEEVFSSLLDQGLLDDKGALAMPRIVAQIEQDLEEDFEDEDLEDSHDHTNMLPTEDGDLDPNLLSARPVEDPDKRQVASSKSDTETERDQHPPVKGQRGESIGSAEQDKPSQTRPITRLLSTTRVRIDPWRKASRSLSPNQPPKGRKATSTDDELLKSAPQRPSDDRWSTEQLLDVLVFLTIHLDSKWPTLLAYLDRLFSVVPRIARGNTEGRDLLAQILNIQGVLLRRVGSWKRSLNTFDQASKYCQWAPTRQMVLFNRGFSRLQAILDANQETLDSETIKTSLPELLLSRKDFSRAARINPDDDAALFQLGFVCYLLGASVVDWTIRRRLSVLCESINAYRRCCELVRSNEMRTLIGENAKLCRSTMESLLYLPWYVRWFGRYKG